jgi:hypothetical protein
MIKVKFIESRYNREFEADVFKFFNPIEKEHKSVLFMQHACCYAPASGSYDEPVPLYTFLCIYDDSPQTLFMPKKGDVL